MSHTEGPYKISKWGKDLVIEDSYEYSIAQVFGGNSRPVAENAALFRAAPDLLEALQAYVEDAESQISHGKPDSPFYKRLQAGRAAIARATGAATGKSV